jgi:hypothetical protein
MSRRWRQERVDAAQVTHRRSEFCVSRELKPPARGHDGGIERGLIYRGKAGQRGRPQSSAHTPITSSIVDRLPFTIYDFFACLSAGLVTLVALAAAFTSSDEWQQTPSAIVCVVLIVVTYMVGHLVANVATFLYEATIVRRWLRMPSEILLVPAQSPVGLQRLFPGYYRPLPTVIRSRVAERSGQPVEDGPSNDAVYLLAFSVVKRDAPTYARLSTFLNLYGFSRNVSLAALVAAACLLTGSLLGTAQTGLVAPGWWAAGALVLAVGLFYRYLKFFRLYAFEVFVTYAADAETS